MHGQEYDEEYFQGRSLISHEVLMEVDLARRHMAPGSCLDVGSGEGRHRYLLEWYGYKVASTDFRDRPLSDHFVGDFLSLRFNQTWDNVVCFHFLEHLPRNDVRAAVAKMASLAKRRVIIVVPHTGRHDYQDDATHQNVSLEDLDSAIRDVIPKARRFEYQSVTWPSPLTLEAWKKVARLFTNRAYYKNIMWAGELEGPT